MSMWKMTWTTGLAVAAAALMMTTTVGAQVDEPDPFVSPDDITVDLDDRTITPGSGRTIPSGTPIRFPADTLVPDTFTGSAGTVRPPQGVTPDRAPGINPDAEPLVRPDTRANDAFSSVEDLRVPADQRFIRPDQGRQIDPDQEQVVVPGSNLAVRPFDQDDLASADETRWLDPTESGFIDPDRARQIDPDAPSPIVTRSIASDPQTRRALGELATDVEAARRLTQRLQTTGRVIRGEFVGVDELGPGSVPQAGALARDLNALGLRLDELERGFRATGFNTEAQRAAELRADVRGLQDQFGGAVLDVTQWDVETVDDFNQTISTIFERQSIFPNPDPFGLLR